MRRLKPFRNRALAGELGLLFVTVVWGAGFVVTKNAVTLMPASFLLVVRFGAAGLLLALVFRKRLRNLRAPDLKAGLLIGLLNFVSYEMQTWGVKYTTAGNNAFLTAVYCVAVPFLYWAVRRRRPTAAHIVSAFLCVAGVGLLSLHGKFSMNPGDLLSLGCGLVFAVQIVAIGIVAETRDPILLAVTQCVFTALAALPAAALTETLPARVPPEAIASLAFLAVCGTALATLIQMVAQKYVAPGKASLIMSLESVFGCLGGILFLGEPAAPRTIEGFALIFAAVVLSELRLPARAAAGLSQVPVKK